MEIISRKEAKEKGLKRYFTGKRCKNGHIAQRLVSSFGCVICENERAQAWKKTVKGKRWQKNYTKKQRINPDKSQRRFTDEEKNEICRLYVEEAKSTIEIAKPLDSSREAINYVLRIKGVKLRTSSESRKGKAKKVSKEEVKAICDEYKDGSSTVDLAKKYPLSTSAIGALLEREGISRRTLSESLNGIAIEKRNEVCRRYINGESQSSLAKKFQCSSGQINRILKKNNIKLRTRTEVIGGLPIDKHDEVARAYANGSNTTVIAKEYNVTPSTIGRYLRRKGIKIRNHSERQNGLPPEQREKLRERYKEGIEQYELAKEFKISPTSIPYILKEGGIKLRTRSEVWGGPPLKEYQSICSRYEKGENGVEIARTYNVSAGVIYRILDINSIQRRKQPVPESLKPIICKSYLEGKSIIRLAKLHKYTEATILKILRSNDIETRSAGGDCVQDVLDSTRLFDRPQDTTFYIYSLRSFPEHLKPGIAFDHKKRANNSQKYYSEVIYLKEFATRKEAFFLEQAVLDQSIDYADCPQLLLDIEWEGTSEVRRMMENDLIEIVEYLLNELEELGIWQFALDYVPMTSYQYIQCQEKLERE